MMTDVLIVGAGPAGCTAALVLARAGVRVRLLDHATFPRQKLCGDSLNPGTLALLDRLGLGALPRARGTPVNGMIVTGEGRACVEGRYPPGVTGRIVSRYELDAWLLEQAIGAGIDFECGVRVVGAVGGDRVTGVSVHTPHGDRTVEATLTIAADGRHSTIAFGLGLSTHPKSPRRWAVGACFADVEGLSPFGEMHIRRDRYIGVAPLPGDLANVCLVTADRQALAGQSDLGGWLRAEVARDPVLGPRVAAARPASKPMVLGPLAVEARAAGLPGLLLAGDAAGFIDPMTGDGMYFAVRGGEIAAAAALAAISGAASAPHEWLAAARAREFGWKQRFNRALRGLVGYGPAVAVASVASRALPSVFRRLVCVAGDLDRHPSPASVLVPYSAEQNYLDR
jgi:menaquinone-9 beta-reductase